jgi:hypothetical protein
LPGPIHPTASTGNDEKIYIQHSPAPRKKQLLAASPPRGIPAVIRVNTEL